MLVTQSWQTLCNAVDYVCVCVSPGHGRLQRRGLWVCLRVCVCVCVCVSRSAMADSATLWTVCVCVSHSVMADSLQRRGPCVCVSCSAMADFATPWTVARPCTVPQLCRSFCSSSLRCSFRPLKPFYLLFSPPLNSPILFSRKTPM